MQALAQRVFWFYRDGFRSMSVGRSLWKLIAIKLFFIFVVLKLFFFPDILHKRFHSDRERAGHVLAELTGQKLKP